ncbi:MAG: phosphatidylcholine/phosphatidylserine synthase [Variibacter sp.]
MKLEPLEPSAPGSRTRIAGFMVHILTASGAALALLALLAATDARWSAMFAWLGLALVVDALDGPLARRLDVARTLPRWSGDTLDLVVDILTYVFVPAYALAASDILPRAAATPLALLVVVTSVIYFADRRMKTSDSYFLGFPAVWNAIVFYLFLLRPPPAMAAGAVFLLALMTFVPWPFVHPFRVAERRTVNLAIVGLWAVLAVWALVRDLSPGLPILTALSVIALYFLGAGLLRRHPPPA